MPDIRSSLVAVVASALGAAALPLGAAAVADGPPATARAWSTAEVPPTAAAMAPASGSASVDDRGNAASGGRGSTDPPSTQRGRWEWPAGPGVLRGFDPPAVRWAPGHRGVDLAAAPGRPVVAPAPGRVAFVGNVAGRPVVALVHADGLRTTYEPVVAIRPVGAILGAGEAFGAVAGGSGGVSVHCGGRPCVHWGVRRGEEYLDPLGFVRRPRIVLLPPADALGYPPATG